MSVLTRSGVLHTSFRRDASMLRTPARTVTTAVGLVVVAVLPFILSPEYLGIANLAWLAILGAISLNLLTGSAGQVSLGQAAFLGFGAYTAVVTLRVLHTGMWIGVPLGGIVTAVIGLLVGLPSLRFRGFYLVLVTLGLHFVAVYALSEYQVHTGGLEGFDIPTQSLFGLQFTTDTRWYYLFAVVGLLTIVASVNLLRSRTGRAWMAVRDRDIAAAIIGINVARYKLLAFVVSAFIAGCAGALAAYYRGNVSIDSYRDLSVAIAYVAMIIVGGLGSTAGAVIGAVVVTALPNWLNDIVHSLPPESSLIQKLQLSIFAVQSAAFGLVIVLFLLFEPRGIVAIWSRVKTWLLLWPYQRSTNEAAP